MTPHRPAHAARARAAAASLVLLFAGLLLLAGCGAHTMPEVKNDDPIQTARDLIDRRDYSAAVELLQGYVDRNGGSQNVDAAIVLLGEAHMRAKEYALAQVQFERLIRDYPESDSSASASFKLALALEKQSRMEDFDQEYTVRALNQYQHYLEEHAGDVRNGEANVHVAELRSKLARKLFNTGELYVKLHQMEAARAYFSRIRDDFADTPVLGHGLIGLAWCDAYEGKKSEAIASLREIEAQFAGQPLAHRAAKERRKIEKRHDTGPPKPVPHAAPETAPGPP